MRNPHGKPGVIGGQGAGILLRLSAVALFILAGCSTETSTVPERSAMEWFEEALDLQAGAVSYDGMDRERINRILDAYTHSIQLDPELVPAYFNRGVLCYETRNHEQALWDFSMAIEKDPGLAMAYEYRGLIYQQKGDGEKAEADFRKAEQLDPALLDDDDVGEEGEEADGGRRPDSYALSGQSPKIIYGKPADSTYRLHRTVRYGGRRMTQAEQIQADEAEKRRAREAREAQARREAALERQKEQEKERATRRCPPRMTPPENPKKGAVLMYVWEDEER